LFALLVPPWQVPDEPAHYNYTRQLAQTGQFPVIAPGDYDGQFIGSQIAPPTARPASSLNHVQYEDHQPPLFYTLAAPAFAVFNGVLIPLRLFSLLVGALVVLFSYLAVRVIFPAYPHLAAFAAAFVALLPQHLYMMAGFNNDALSEALLAAVVGLSALFIVRRLQSSDERRRRVLNGEAVLLGLLVGLAFLTKAQAYLALPVALFAVFVSGYKRRPGREIVLALLLVTGIAVLIGLPWWIHSMETYGGADFLGLQRHNEVVAGQPTSAEWIVQYGWGGLLSRMALFTFQSFWGQFGWMSIVLDRRFYLLFLAVTAVSALLFLAWWVAVARAKRAKVDMIGNSGVPISLTRAQSLALTMLALLAVGALLGFIWYNLQFVQHQGRYLYAGLIPIATALALGWHYAISKLPQVNRLQRWLWLALLVAMIALDGHLLFRVILPAMQG
jgi:4-amino-4-deoxy-L-arabinose transferase-like glycosyltransferase